MSTPISSTALRFSGKLPIMIIGPMLDLYEHHLKMANKIRIMLISGEVG